MDRVTARSLLAYNPIRDRCIGIRLQAKPVNVTLIQVYAPTSTADEEECDRFYEHVQQAIDLAPKRDMLFVIGDWSTNIGQSAVKTRLGGTRGISDKNEKGEKLKDFCISNVRVHLAITNTMFQQPKRRLWTWRSSTGNVRTR